MDLTVLPAHPANEMNHTCLPSQPKLVLIYRPRRDGRLSLPWVTGWLHTEINVCNRQLNPDMVTCLSTNRARRWLTSLIEAHALTTMPDHQPCETVCVGTAADPRLVGGDVNCISRNGRLHWRIWTKGQSPWQRMLFDVICVLFQLRVTLIYFC